MASRSFPAAPRSVSEARSFALAHAPWAADTDLEVLVSELATNAVLHSGTSFELTVDARPGAVRVEVSDSCGQLPNHRDQRDDTTTGRGLYLVAALASRWGYHAHDGGKVIWAEVAVHDPPTPVEPNLPRARNELR